MSREFRVIKTLGGCGGTILARALSANGALVLSEINPRSANLFAGALNPLVQMNAHHFALLPDRLRGIDVHTLGHPRVFGRFMAELVDAVDRPIVIRDYSYVDYIGVPFVWPRPSQACLMQALRPFGTVRAATLVRHPAATLDSLLRHPPLATVLDAETFVAGHLAFYDDNAELARFRFEDFLDDPDRVVASLSAALDLPYDAAWQGQLAGTAGLTGNRDALAADVIEPPSGRSEPVSRQALAGVDGYARLLSLGGYD